VSTRTDLARRLELAQVEEAGDLVTGRARGLVVALEGEPPFTGCVVDLGAAIPIASMVMRAGDLNHPDAVETGDAAFDEVMQVVALKSYAPTLQKLLDDQALRTALLEFFQRHPSAVFNGSRLHVPSASGVTQQVVIDALAMAETVAKRFAVIGFLESEPAATLPPTRSLAPRLALTAGGSAVGFVVLAALFGAQADAFGGGAGVLFVAICVFAVLLTRPENH
jgi:hypothetical protein